ncbi:hypothetical protein K437DRAFT_261004 [Tilletiaria anomala UBC 951]|uniref:Uncharacterized protein n=1 Tax=Tilletiaria anomala (strain ATCC 24038 / CBS 436.72 / UBC 951) TaxID=1037660 RepID=A0A066WPV3_TILAU|nr:uncharacterized protein K437DRAFT_261004 [Tilletiaria anomala UBC 951]KDN53034.1 hypothetical protein K437DRAFT_261004 [Tilletiaria anomala UBC 951]
MSRVAGRVQGAPSAAAQRGTSSSNQAPGSGIYPSASSPTPLLLSSIGTLALPPSFLQERYKPSEQPKAGSRARAADGSTDTEALTRLLNLIRHLSSLAVVTPSCFSCFESLAGRVDDEQHFASIGKGTSSSAGQTARWAPVTKARLGSGMSVEREAGGRCFFTLYKEPLQSRASHPSISVRPYVRTGIAQQRKRRMQRDGPLKRADEKALLETLHKGKYSSADPKGSAAPDDWADACEALGWRFKVHHMRQGIRFILASPASVLGNTSTQHKRPWFSEVTVFRLFTTRAPRTRPLKAQAATLGSSSTAVDSDVVMKDGEGAKPAALIEDRNSNDNEEVAPGTVFVLLRTTIPVDAALSAGGDDVLDQAKEWTADIIAGIKAFVVLQKDE